MKHILQFLVSLLCVASLHGQAIQSPHQPRSSTLTDLSNGTWTGSTAITTLGTISLGTWSGTVIAVNKGGTGATSAADARTNLGLVIGTDVQAYDAVLAALAALADGAGVLTNNGGGALSYTGTAAGTAGNADNAKLALFSTVDNIAGSLSARSLAAQDNTWPGVAFAQLFSTNLAFKNIGNLGFDVTVYAPTPTASRTLFIPDAGGTFITTGNLTDITAVGTVASGTWSGTAIAVNKGGTGSTTAAAARVALLPSLAGNNGKVLAVNAGQTDVEWVTGGSGGGLTVGTSAITSGTSGRILYNNAGVLGEMTTSGSGTQIALTNSPTFTTPALGTPSAIVLTNASGSPTGITLTRSQLNSIVSDGDPAYLSTANVFSIAQMVDGSTDSTQFIVQGHSSQTNPVLAVQNSSGTNVMTVSSAGATQVISGQNYTEIASTAIGYYDNSVGFLWRLNNSYPFVNGGAALKFGALGAITWQSTNREDSGTADLLLWRDSAATLQLGMDVNGAPVVQTIKAHDGITGTNLNGASLILSSGNSTGTGTSTIIFSTPAAGSSGTTPRTASERARVNEQGLQVGGIIFWYDQTAVPTSNPPSGYIYLYRDPADNALKCRHTTGTITTLSLP